LSGSKRRSNNQSSLQGGAQPKTAKVLKKKPDRGVSNGSDEETADPFIADQRNFYKVEKWTKDGTKVDRLLYAGNNLKTARGIFVEAVMHRPRIRLTIRQRTRVLNKWPQA
jgi:hypothetical protein